MEMDNTASLHMDNGASLHMDNGASLHMDNGASLHLDNGAHLHVDNGASLHIDNAVSLEMDNTSVGMDNTTSLEMDNTASLRMNDAASLHMDHTDSLHMDNTASLHMDSTASLHMDNTDSLDMDNAVSLHMDNVASLDMENAVSLEICNDDTLDMDHAASMDMDEYACAITPFTPATPIEPTDNNEIINSQTQPNKRRRKKSIVWEHFTIETVGPGCTRACCKQCKKSFAYITGSKLAGTSHLKRHIALGICPVSRQRNQQETGNKTGNATDPPKRRYRASPGYANTPVDHNVCYNEIAKMIMLHEYPLHIVEHSGFINFVRTLQPQFNMASFNTIQGDCVAMYLREKQSLLDFIRGIPGHVNLSLDLWTSNHSLAYVILTGHFVDQECNLHRRILNVAMVASPDSDCAFNQALGACLSDWNLESKLLTLTIDQSISNELPLRNLRGFLSARNTLMFNGQLLIGSCYARVLSHLAQEGLGTISETIKRFRDIVKYVKTSDSNEDKFFELKRQLQVPSTKELLIDDQTKWDTTYNMLVAVCEHREVFSCFESSDSDYYIAPSMDDWKQVELLCVYLKLFHDAASILTGPTFPPANAFYHEVSKVQIELTHAAMTQDEFISGLTKPLKEKFDRYWNECFLVLATAVVMDPRFKMKLIEFSFSKIYGEDAGMWIKVIDDSIHELYSEYTSQPHVPPETFSMEGNEVIPKTETSQEGFPQGHTLDVSTQDIPLISIGDGLSDFEVYISEITSSQQMKCELDQYLEESLLPRSQDFDVLGWWKLNKSKYPNLSKMACDILSVPFSTVAPDSVFDTKKKKMDTYRCSLRPVTLEALICAKDWFQYGSLTPASTDLQNGLLRMEF